MLFQMSVHMRRLEDNGQPLQRVGNQLMMKMVERGYRRIKVKHKSRQDEVSVTDTEQQTSEHLNFLFYMSIQGDFAFCCNPNFSKFRELFEILTSRSLQISKPYLDSHVMNL